MKVNCGKGHEYDTDRYSACPYCNPSLLQSASVTDANRTAPVGGGFAYADPSVSTYAPTAPIEDLSQSRASSGDAEQRKVTSASATTPLYVEKYGQESPVVGWVVCVFGEELGRGFPLYGGRNTIGRGKDVSVELRGDLSISASSGESVDVYYYAEQNLFVIDSAGFKSSVVMLNGEDMIMNTRAKLKLYDEIAFGKTKLLFVPFCSEHFTWDKAYGSDGVK